MTRKLSCRKERRATAYTVPVAVLKVDSLEVYEENINLEEVQPAVSSLMNNKAPGVDEISAEMLKHDKETVAEQLAELFNMIWQDLKVPEDWKKGVIIKLPKKGSLKDCNNHPTFYTLQSLQQSAAKQTARCSRLHPTG